MPSFGVLRAPLDLGRPPFHLVRSLSFSSVIVMAHQKSNLNRHRSPGFATFVVIVHIPSTPLILTETTIPDHVSF